MTKAEEAAMAYRSLNPLLKTAGIRSVAKVVPIFQWNAYQKIETIKEGISKEELENLKEQTGIDYNMLSKVLAVTKATLHNKKGKERFDAAISERILRLADIYSYGYTVFKDQEKFNRWMKAPNRALGYEAPLNLAETIYGMEEVRNIIGRIEYGVYS